TRNYVPKAGDTLIIDISVRLEGKWCDVCRTFFFGEPSPEQKAVFDLVARSISAGEKVLKKGKSAKTVYKAVNEVYQKKGFSLVHHAGHKIGTRALMQPQFLPQKGTRIKLGEYYTIESGLYEGFGLRLENDYLITENGSENLFIDLMPFDLKEYILK
ncbi:MAG: aminopeptidase P family protein, partial [Clostridia bacterium]|nr:aminopeptidase P family protein [Clostridia bacterium]